MESGILAKITEQQRRLQEVRSSSYSLEYRTLFSYDLIQMRVGRNRYVHLCIGGFHFYIVCVSVRPCLR